MISILHNFSSYIENHLNCILPHCIVLIMAHINVFFHIWVLDNFWICFTAINKLFHQQMENHEIYQSYYLSISSQSATIEKVLTREETLRRFLYKRRDSMNTICLHDFLKIKTKKN